MFKLVILSLLMFTRATFAQNTAIKTSNISENNSTLPARNASPELADVIIGNPVAKYVYRTDGGLAHTDRYFTFISQVFAGSQPVEATPDAHNDAVAGYFAAYCGVGAGAGCTAVNPLVQWVTRPAGTVTCEGGTVTWVSGDPFQLTGWNNSTIEINHVTYDIDHVIDGHHLLLKTLAGSHATPNRFTVGGALFGMEVDVNAPSDVDPESAVGYNGVQIVSGGNGKPLAGLSILGSHPDGSNAWRYGMQINNFTHKGILMGNPAAEDASALDVTNGTAASSFIRGAGGSSGSHPSLIIAGVPQNMLQFWPSSDAPGNVEVYGSNADNNQSLWSIRQDGTATMKQFVSSVSTGTPPISVSSTTPASNLNSYAVSYAANGTQKTNSFIVSGHIELERTGATTVDFAHPFSTSGSYACTAVDTDGIHPVQVTRKLGSQVTFRGTASDGVDYICIGN